MTIFIYQHMSHKGVVKSFHYVPSHFDLPFNSFWMAFRNSRIAGFAAQRLFESPLEVQLQTRR